MIAPVAAAAALAVLARGLRPEGHVPGRPRALCFHKITPGPCLEGTWYPPGRFARALDALRADGWRFVDLARYLDGVAHPAPEREREVLVTIDDVYEDAYACAWPVLRERRIPVHLFVVSDCIGRVAAWEWSFGRRRARHAGEGHIREMLAGGATLGSHTATHADLTRVAPERRRDELERSRRALEDRFGCAVATVSWPYGRVNAASARAAQACGYVAGFALYPRRGRGVPEPFALRRDPVYVIDAAAGVGRRLGRGVGAAWDEVRGRGINAVAALSPLLRRLERTVRGS